VPPPSPLRVDSLDPGIVCAEHGQELICPFCGV
jgi:hypothetical protein